MSEKLAVLFPGVGYQIDRPLLYHSAKLARERGWTDTLLAEHFVAVRAEYDAEYDHTKTFLEDGHITQFFYLMQYDNGTWRITDSGMRQAG